MTSDSSCNHYVTHPSSLSLCRFSQPRSFDRYSTPPLSRPPLPIPLTRERFDYSYYLILKPFLFPPVRHFTPKRPIDSQLLFFAAHLAPPWATILFLAIPSLFPFRARSLAEFRSDPACSILAEIAWVSFYRNCHGGNVRKFARNILAVDLPVSRRIP